MGGVVPNITAVLLAVNGGPFAGLIPPGIKGIAHQYPQINDVLNQYILPERLPDLNKADSRCLLSDIPLNIGLDFFSWTKTGNKAFLSDPRVQQVLNDNTLGLSPYMFPQAPLYMYHSNLDEVAPVRNTDLLYSSYCAKGVRINYQKSLISDHVTEMVEGSAGAFSWLIDRLEGKPIANVCSTKTTLFSAALNIKNLQVFGTIIAGDLLGLLGRTLGPPSV